MEVTIEPAETGEVDTIAELWVALASGQREYGSHLLTEPNRMIVRESIVRHAVSDSVLVARADDELVGFIMFTVQSGTYEQDVTRGVIENLYVVPERRREGIGSDLVEAAHESLAVREIDAIGLEVMAGNEEAREFYRHLGYKSHRVELERPVENDTHSKGGE